MSARPHEYYNFKDDGLTVDFRVFWRPGTDPQVVLNEVFMSYTELVGQLQERFSAQET